MFHERLWKALIEARGGNAPKWTHPHTFALSVETSTFLVSQRCVERNIAIALRTLVRGDRGTSPKVSAYVSSYYSKIPNSRGVPIDHFRGLSRRGGDGRFAPDGTVAKTREMPMLRTRSLASAALREAGTGRHECDTVSNLWHHPEVFAKRRKPLVQSGANRPPPPRSEPI